MDYNHSITIIYLRELNINLCLMEKVSTIDIALLMGQKYDSNKEWISIDSIKELLKKEGVKGVMIWLGKELKGKE